MIQPIVEHPIATCFILYFIFEGVIGIIKALKMKDEGWDG